MKCLNIEGKGKWCAKGEKYLMYSSRSLRSCDSVAKTSFPVSSCKTCCLEGLVLDPESSKRRDGCFVSHVHHQGPLSLAISVMLVRP